MASYELIASSALASSGFFIIAIAFLGWTVWLGKKEKMTDLKLFGHGVALFVIACASVVVTKTGLAEIGETDVNLWYLHSLSHLKSVEQLLIFWSAATPVLVGGIGIWMMVESMKPHLLSHRK